MSENDNQKKNPLKRKISASIQDVVVKKKEKKTEPPASSFVGPLLTDFYQITMAYALWKTGRHKDPAVFDLFFRTNPFHGEFTIFAGLEEVVRHVSNFHFTDDDISFLKEQMPTCEDEFFEWMKSLDCSEIKLYSLPEGTVVFPRIPLIRVEGPMGIAQLLETTLLTLVNYPSLLVTNAARHRLAAGEQMKLLEFGLRRAQGPDGGVSASRYAYMGGFDGTSNVLASKLFGIPAKGTHAHSFVSCFQDEGNLGKKTLKDCKGEEHDFLELVKKCRRELGFKNTNDGELIAFTAYAISFPGSFLALVDTYDTLKSGILNFLTVAYALHKLGYRALGVRLDSGDLAYLSEKTRRKFKEVSERLKIDYFQNFDIVASNDIHEATILSLNAQGHQINSYGIGTHLVTCKAQPALGCVYKLVAIRDQPRIKISQDVSKVSLPGRKDAYRLFGQADYPIIDILIQAEEKSQVPHVGDKIKCLHPFDQQKRAYVTPTKVVKLHKLYWDGYEVQETLPSLHQLRNYVIEQLKSMRSDHLRETNPTPYKVSVTEQLYHSIHRLWDNEVPIQDIFDQAILTPQSFFEHSG